VLAWKRSCIVTPLAAGTKTALERDPMTQFEATIDVISGDSRRILVLQQAQAGSWREEMPLLP
jgi:hypothetical protein